MGADEKNGASDVVARVRRYARLNDFQVVVPARWAKDGKLAEFDCVLVGYFGVLGIRCMGYSGRISAARRGRLGADQGRQAVRV